MKTFNKIQSTILILITILSLFGCSRKEVFRDSQFLFDTICTIEASGDNAAAGIKAAFDALTDLQKKTDRFSDTSFVSQINKAKADEYISLTDDLYHIFETALDIAENSGGAFDITIAPVSDLWDFKNGEHKIPNSNELKSATEKVDYRNLILDKETKSIRKKYDYIKVDLGGVVKGYAADLANEILTRYNAEHIMIDLGGNIYVSGKNPKSPKGHFTVGIQEPFEKAGVYTRTEVIDTGAVVTSGSYQRYFEKDGVIYHHILNPKDGYPVQNSVNSVTIVSDSALVADCLSTACFVLGVEEGESLADKFGAKAIWIE